MTSHTTGGAVRGRRLAAALAAALGAVLAATAALFATSAAEAAVDTGTWYAIESRHSGLVFDIKDGSTEPGAELTQWGYGGSENQQFRFIDAGGGYYRIQARHSGLVLDVYEWNAENGATIAQWTDLGGTNQQWQVNENSEGYVSFINRFSGKALDVWEWSTAHGARISQYDPTGGTNQQFRLIPVDDGDDGGGDDGGDIDADLTVAADGSGTHTTVQAAVDAASDGYTILVKPGTYRGNVTVPSDLTGITLIGATGDATDVVITDDRCAGCDNGSGGTWGTTGSASVTLNGNDFTAEDLTFSNSYDEAANGNSQAVAVKVNGDRMVFENVRFLGNQDTLYANSPDEDEAGRQYYHDCYVEGDVDFIFGRGTAVFDNCTIRSLDRGSDSNNGYVTAASTEITNPYGYLFTGCDFVSDAPEGSVYLGRPWPAGGSETARGQVLVRESNLDSHIRDDPWTDMSGLDWHDARLREYANTGPGSGVNDDRPQMSSSEAANYEASDYLSGSDGWNPM